MIPRANPPALGDDSMKLQGTPTRWNPILALAVFSFLIAAVYTVWSLLQHGGVEWVGTVALAFLGLMSTMIAFYIGRVLKAQRGELPEDTLTADIDDGDPEMGEFSPWSWWPIVLAASAAIAFAALVPVTPMLPRLSG